MGILNSKPIFFRVLNHMAILAEPLLSSHLFKQAILDYQLTACLRQVWLYTVPINGTDEVSINYTVPIKGTDEMNINYTVPISGTDDVNINYTDPIKGTDEVCINHSSH